MLRGRSECPRTPRGTNFSAGRKGVREKGKGRNGVEMERWTSEVGEERIVLLCLRMRRDR
jgi:hypothetical protein